MSKVDYKVLGEFLDYDDLQLEYDRVINNILLNLQMISYHHV